MEKPIQPQHLALFQQMDAADGTADGRVSRQSLLKATDAQGKQLVDLNGSGHLNAGEVDRFVKKHGLNPEEASVIRRVALYGDEAVFSGEVSQPLNRAYLEKAASQDGKTALLRLNGLYRKDPQAFRTLYGSLSREAKLELARSQVRDWAKLDTAVLQTVFLDRKDDDFKTLLKSTSRTDVLVAAMWLAYLPPDKLAEGAKIIFAKPEWETGKPTGLPLKGAYARFTPRFDTQLRIFGEMANSANPRLRAFALKQSGQFLDNIKHWSGHSSEDPTDLGIDPLARKPGIGYYEVARPGAQQNIRALQKAGTFNAALHGKATQYGLRTLELERYYGTFPDSTAADKTATAVRRVMIRSLGKEPLQLIQYVKKHADFGPKELTKVMTTVLTPPDADLLAELHAGLAKVAAIAQDPKQSAAKRQEAAYALGAMHGALCQAARGLNERQKSIVKFLIGAGIDKIPQLGGKLKDLYKLLVDQQDPKFPGGERIKRRINDIMRENQLALQAEDGQGHALETAFITGRDIYEKVDF